MAQHTCSNCGTEFIDGDFCPECGQWLETDASEEFALDSEPVGQTIPYDTVPCPSCGSANPSTNRHCEECGARLHQGALPVAPQPMIQTSAAIRAAAVIGVVLIVVIAGSWIFNRAFGGDTPEEIAATSTTVTTVAAPASPLVTVPVVSWNCSTSLNESFDCANLFDGNDETSWNDASARGVDAVITATFDGAYSLESLIITNLEDPTRFGRNYRIQGFDITTDDQPAPLTNIIPNQPGAHLVNFISLRTTTITITVTTIYASEEIEDQQFDELAVQEIQFFGRAVLP